MVLLEEKDASNAKKLLETFKQKERAAQYTPPKPGPVTSAVTPRPRALNEVGDARSAAFWNGANRITGKIPDAPQPQPSFLSGLAGRAVGLNPLTAAGASAFRSIVPQGVRDVLGGALQDTARKIGEPGTYIPGGNQIQRQIERAPVVGEPAAEAFGLIPQFALLGVPGAARSVGGAIGTVAGEHAFSSGAGALGATPGQQQIAGAIGGLAGGVAGFAAGPAAARGFGRGATAYRDLTKNIPVGLSLENVGKGTLGEQLSNQIDDFTTELGNLVRRRTNLTPEARAIADARATELRNNIIDLRDMRSKITRETAGRASEQDLLDIADFRARVSQIEPPVAPAGLPATTGTPVVPESLPSGGRGPAVRPGQPQGTFRPTGKAPSAPDTSGKRTAEIATQEAQQNAEQTERIRQAQKELAASRARIPTRPEGGPQTLRKAQAPENSAAQIQLNRARAAANKADRVLNPVVKVGNRTWRTSVMETLTDLLSVPGSLWSSIDFSAFRQGAISTAGHPRIAAHAARKQLQAFASEAGYQEANAALAAKPHAALRDASGVVMSTMEKGLTGEESRIVSRMLDAIGTRTVSTGAGAATGYQQGDTREEKLRNALIGAGIGLAGSQGAKMLGVPQFQLYRGSQRAYVTYLNVLRDGVFESMLKRSGLNPANIPPEELERWGQMVNVFTGRGNLPAFLAESKIGGRPVLWAARLLASRVQTPMMLASKSPAVRAEARRSIGAFVGLNLTLLTLAKASGAIDVELDPRSADFGQFRFGDVREDPWMGFRPVANLYARIASGSIKSTRTGEIYAKDRLAMLRDFGLQRVDPLISTVVAHKRGVNAIGQSVSNDPEIILAELLSPLNSKDLFTAVRKYGVWGAAVNAPGIVGGGVNIHDTSAEDQFARDQGVKTFAQLPPADRAAYLQSNPEVRDQRSEDRLQAGGDTKRLEELRIQYTSEQTASDNRLANGELNTKEWRADLGEREMRARAAYNAIAGNRPDYDPKILYKGTLVPLSTTPLGGYYKALDQAGKDTGDGTQDWGVVDAYRAALSDEDNAYIDSQTGLSSDSQNVRDVRAFAKVLTNSGYWKQRDDVWAQIVGSSGGQIKALDQYGSFYDWRDAMVNEKIVTARKKLEDPLAQRNALKVVNAMPIARLFSGLLERSDVQWTKEHPELIEEAVKWGYDSLNDRNAAIIKIMRERAGVSQ